MADEHRLVKAVPVRCGPWMGMEWDCSCGDIGTCAADIAELTWYEHTKKDSPKV